MSRLFGIMVVAGSALSCMLAAGGAQAAEPSGCVACHTDEAALVRNLARLTARKSALQSGAG